MVTELREEWAHAVPLPKVHGVIGKVAPGRVLRWVICTDDSSTDFGKIYLQWCEPRGRAHLSTEDAFEVLLDAEERGEELPGEVVAALRIVVGSATRSS